MFRQKYIFINFKKVSNYSAATALFLIWTLLQYKNQILLLFGKLDFQTN